LPNLRCLKPRPRELWLGYLAYLLEIIAYGVLNPVLTLWLSSDLGYNDAKAGK